MRALDSRIHFSHSNKFKKVHAQIPDIHITPFHTNNNF